MIIKQPIEALALMLSCGCNLSCKYCLINQNKNQNSSIIQSQTINALQDGTFLNNTLKVLNKLSTSPLSIKYMEFWGQEPTLTLNHFTNNLENWLDAFPNLIRIMFSTNMKNHSDRIINFIKKLEQISTQKMTIVIQFSYDDNFSNNNLREIDSNLITKNIQKIIEELNQIKLSKVKVRFIFHAVLSKELINNLQDMEQVNAYCENLFEWPKQFYNLNYNNNVTIKQDIDLGLEVPANASQNDGIKFANFCKLLKKSPYNQSHNNIVLFKLKGLFQEPVEYTLKQCCNQNNNLSILELLQKINENNKNLNKNISLNSGYCGANYNELKIMFDGTILNCQNEIFDTNLDFINQENKFLYSIKKNQIVHNKILNPLTASDEELITLFNTYQKIKENNFKIIFNNILNLMTILADSGLIDTNYLDNKIKLLIHAFYIQRYNNCTYNKMIKTGNSFFCYSDLIRLLCNGALTEILGEN